MEAAALLHKYPELCLFLSIVLGHVIGAYHFKGVGFGNVVGTLIAGIAIGIYAKPGLNALRDASGGNIGALGYSNAKILFQSDFMLTTVQPLAIASSQALSSLPMCDCRS